MNVVKETIRYYRKYAYSDFVQPTLTANGSFGGSAMAVSHTFGSKNSSWGTTYKVFSPNTDKLGFYCDEYKGHMYIYIYLPKPTRLTHLSFYVPHTSDSSGGAYNTKLYAGYSQTDRRVLIKDIGKIAEKNSCNVNLTNANYFNYYTLYIENGGSAYEDQVEIKDVLLSGVCREVVNGTSQDYDFIEENNTYKAIVENEYYKAFKF